MDWINTGIDSTWVGVEPQTKGFMTPLVARWLLGQPRGFTTYVRLHEDVVVFSTVQAKFQQKNAPYVEDKITQISRD